MYCSVPSWAFNGGTVAMAGFAGVVFGDALLLLLAGILIIGVLNLYRLWRGKAELEVEA